MSDATYRITEIVGTSPDSVQTAIDNAIARANKTLRGLDWFEVVEIRGRIDDGEAAHYQVTTKIGFRMDD